MSVLFVNMSLPHNVYDAAQAVQKAYEVIYDTVRRLKGEYALTLRSKSIFSAGDLSNRSCPLLTSCRRTTTSFLLDTSVSPRSDTVLLRDASYRASRKSISGLIF